MPTMQTIQVPSQCPFQTELLLWLFLQPQEPSRCPFPPVLRLGLLSHHLMMVSFLPLSFASLPPPSQNCSPHQTPPLL